MTRRIMRRVAGGVLVVAGVVAAGTALALPAGPAHPGGAGFLVYAGLLALGLAAARLFVLSWPRPARPGPAPRGALLALAGCAVVVGVWAVPAAAADFGSGLPGPRRPLLAAALVLVVVGVGLALPGSGAAATGARRPVLLAWLAGLLLVPGLVLADFAAVQSLPVRATTAAAVPPPKVPAAPSGQRWSWTAPAQPLEVASGGAGVVARLTDRLVGLAGRDGAVRWTYRRPGTDVIDSAVSPDGSRVLALLRTRHGGSDASGLLVVLDADTGAVIRTDESRFTATPWIGNRVRLYRETSTQLRATWLDTGREAWTWKAPAGCEIIDGTSITPTPTGPILLVVCADQDHHDLGIGLDEATGRERWRTDLPRTRDRTLRSGISAGTGTDVVAVDDDFLLDTATGKVGFMTGPGQSINIPHARFPQLVRNAEGGRSGVVLVLHDITTGTDVPKLAQTGSCTRGLLTSDAFLWLCAGDRNTLRLDSFALPGGQLAASMTLPLGGTLPINPDKMLTVAPGAVVAWSDRHRTLYGLA